MNGVIYILKNIYSDKVYIGMTSRSVEQRWKEHLRKAFWVDADDNFVMDLKIHKAIRELPLDSWSINVLYQYKNDGTELPLGEYEKFYITKYNSIENGFNTTIGGIGSSGIESSKLRESQLKLRSTHTKGYTFVKPSNKYVVQLTVYKRNLKFNRFNNEEDAKLYAQYLFGLSDTELLSIHEEYRRNFLNRTKGYTFREDRQKYVVTLRVNGKAKHFGQYLTELEAINKVTEVRKELGII